MSAAPFLCPALKVKMHQRSSVLLGNAVPAEESGPAAGRGAREHAGSLD